MSVEWITVPEYMRRTGISRDNLKNLLDEDRLVHIKTEGNQPRILMKENDDVIALKEELHEQRRLIEKLCNHLGVE
jgi:hypothetical protein